jgi:hypothetical protein
MSSSEEKIIKAFKDKDWNEIKTSDSWQIFKIMSEFVQGFEKLAKIGPVFFLEGFYYFFFTARHICFCIF